MTDSITLQKALLAIKKLKKLLNEKESFEPIAIVGLGCRFPNVKNKNEYWELLSKGKNIITPLSQERWNLLENTNEIDMRNENHPYWGGYLSNIADFDAYFFGISPREAVRMDPQQRIMLEVSYEAIEDAGLTIEKLTGSNTGIFASLYASQYGHMQEIESEIDALYIPTGNAISIAANRLSYLFDFRGPSIVVDTACSSSLVSLHLACLNLQNKLCDLALVCGANINLLPSINLLLTQAKMLSLDGQCKTFDASANGYVPGEGVGVIVLKTLKKALQDNDRVYAVINSVSVNQDGKTNGLTAPNGLQQEAILRSAYGLAKIEPQQVSYVECHGTGTFLGDPIELQALGEVVSKNRHEDNPCWIGSVKTNIGHLEPAAGIASIIKVALSLQRGKIPPHLNYNTPNPYIAFDKYHLKVVRELQDWPRYGDYRIAGVSGFGFGGTNAHAVITEYKQECVAKFENKNKPKEIFTISAKDPVALQELISAWTVYLEKNINLDIEQICYNTHVRRSHYLYRLAIVVNSSQELYNALLQIKDNSSTFNENIYIHLDAKNQPINSKDDIYAADFDPKQLAKIYVSGTDINWQKYESNRNYSLIDMPLYCWQHKSYWPTMTKNLQQTKNANNHPLQGRQILSPLDTFIFEFIFDTKNLPELRDTYNVVHAGYYLEMLAFAINQAYKKTEFTIEDLAFISALIVPNDSVSMVQLIVNKSESGRIRFNFYSHSKPNWIEHANGNIILEVSEIDELEPIEIIKNKATESTKAQAIYEKVNAMNMPTGESIRWSQHYWQNQNQILCQFSEPENCKNTDNFQLKIHPGVFDGSIQPLFKLLSDNNCNPYMAAKISRFKYHGTKEGSLYLLSRLDSDPDSVETVSGDSYLLTANNEVVAEIKGIKLKRLKNTVGINELIKSNEQREKINLSLLSPQDSKHYIVDFLIEQVAMIFSMPQKDIEVNRSLLDMGMDSLMSLVFVRALEQEFGVNYSADKILQGPTINDITDFILKNYKDDSSDISEKIYEKINKPTNQWIAYRENKTDAKLRLFCFPYGGGGASIYREWQQNLPDSIEVCPIQLPGRENRMEEMPIHTMDSMMNQLIENIQNEFDMPFAFFGHSFGSLIAFELTRNCRKFGLPIPEHLFVSAFPDPRIPPTSLNNMLNELQSHHIHLLDLNTPDKISQLSDAHLLQLVDTFQSHGIVDYGDYLANKNIIKFLLPIFIGDMSIVKSYQYHDEAPLDVPISVFLGKNDQWVSPNELLNWKKYTNKTCSFYEFAEGHLFLKEKQIRSEILHIIINSLDMDRMYSKMQEM